jgi:glutamate-1-semialdehyde 2,1-aminomutase
MGFHFDHLDELKKLAHGREREIAAIVVEPARGMEATAFLKGLREFASEIGAVLIFDEITSAFRMCPGGIHLRLGVEPDVAVFAKCMANGYAMAAVLGRESVMQAAQSTFISSTNWTERIGPTASLATIKKYRENHVHEHIIKIGAAVQDVWRETAAKNGVDINVTGIPTLGAFGFKGETPMELNTVFTVQMLDLGFLGFRQFKPAFAHTMDDVEAYRKACDEVFGRIARHGVGLLESPRHHGGFYRLTKE